MTSVERERELPLFPLQAVLFPGGLLRMKVFESRYLDLVSACLRDRRPFGVVALRAVRATADSPEDRAAAGFEAIGTRAELAHADSDQPGILQVQCRGTGRGLANAIATLKAKGESLFDQPYRFDDAGWVANRWCEILPISQAAKQKLMALPDLTVRLQLVDDFLRSKGVVG